MDVATPMSNRNEWPSYPSDNDKSGQITMAISPMTRAATESDARTFPRQMMRESAHRGQLPNVV